MTDYTYVDVPNATVKTISRDGLEVGGYFINSNNEAVGFVENLLTHVYAGVSDPNAGGAAFQGTVVNTIGADGDEVGGYYTNSSGTSVGFEEITDTGVYIDVSGPDESGQPSQVTTISGDGDLVGGDYINGSGNVSGFIRDSLGEYSAVSDPNGVSTYVGEISDDATTVAGYYVTGDADYIGFVENIASGVYTDVSDPNAIQSDGGTYIAGISSDGGTVAGYYSISPSSYEGFVEDVATGVYTEVDDPNAVYGTIVKGVSGDGSTVTGYYIRSDGDDVGFVENVATGAYTDVDVPSGSFTTVVGISADGQTVAGEYGAPYPYGNEGYVATDLACFGRGTSILTARGEVAVELLEVGNSVVTASGGLRPIVWIGHRRIDVARHPDPKAVRPFCVSADAFGKAKPSRDVWLSPGHNIAAEGVLIGICTLENGKSVVQHPVDSVEYWHVELDAHDVLLAQGLAAESYLDCGNRTGFVEGGAFIEAHPDFRARPTNETCAPVVNEGPQIARVKAQLLEQLQLSGHFVTSQADIHLLVDGERIEPIQLSDTRFAFAPARSRADIRLMSRVFVPAHTLANSRDTRSLGICVKRLQIDGEDIALDGEALLGSDWQDAEPGRRWTRGSAALPRHARLILIDLAGPGHYWSERNNNVFALRARA